MSFCARNRAGRRQGSVVKPAVRKSTSRAIARSIDSRRMNAKLVRSTTETDEFDGVPERRDGCCVEFRVDRHHIQRRDDPVDEVGRHCGAVTTAGHRQGLDDDIGMGHEGLDPPERECQLDACMRRIIAVDEGEDPARVHE